MNQKRTRFKQRLQAYLLPALMFTLSMAAKFAVAQSTTCNCTTSSSNLLKNGSFENTSTGWSVSGGSLTFGSTYAVCGYKNAYLTQNCGTAKIWQKLTSITAGKAVTLKAWAGTHYRGLSCSPKITLSFYNCYNTLLQTYSVTVDKNVDIPDYKLKEYTISATAPSGTYYTKVEASIGCNTLKLDALCLTTSTSTPLGSIGDKVWKDNNCNGIQDSGEPGICGVTVQLKNSAGSVVGTATTNSNGAYVFNGLAAGNYTVVFPAVLSGAVLTAQAVGSNRDTDSNPNQSTGVTPVIALASGQNITNVDAGYCVNTMSLGNRVWFDANCNGFNDNEHGISGVRLNLYKDANNDNVADGAAIATTTTDAYGYYLFRNLVAGNYIVGAVVPSGYVSSSVNGGDPDNNINLDDNGQVLAGSEIRGLAITLLPGTEPDGSCGYGNSNITYDFGFCTSTPPANCDCTGSSANLLTNGSFESGSTGWSYSGGSLTTGTGYVVCGYKNAFLSQSYGTAKVWQQVTAITAGSTVTFKGFAGTHTQGIYCNPRLTLAFYNSANVLLSSVYATVDKDVDKPDYKLKEYTLTAVAPAGTYYTRVEGSIGCNVLKLDALCLTYTPPLLGCIGDRVWVDLNTNGKQDSGEPGIGGVNVKLTYPNGATANTATDANGWYKFCSLPAGTYTVTFGNPGSQYVPTLNNEGDNDEIDSDPVNSVVSGITLDPGQSNLTIDAGFILNNLNLGDRVWYDQNKNGLQDAGELGVAGIKVNLYEDADGDNEPDGDAIATTTTNANGVYGFGSLAPGKYIVGITVPEGYDATITTATSETPDNDNNTDNNGVATVSGELLSNYITLTNGGEPTNDGDGNNGNLSLDFGLIGEASLGDYVWHDLNANGIQESNEPGIANVPVTLTFPNGATAATVTDASGYYLFTDLAAGTYAVTFGTPSGFVASPSNVGSDDAKDSDPVNGVVSGIVLANGQEDLTIDAGFYCFRLNLGDYVWYDQNNNGLQDANEKGIEGVTVNLYQDANGDNAPDGAAVATTVTDANGYYNFASLAPGKYIAAVVIPAGYKAAVTTATSAVPDNDNNGDNNGVTTTSSELFSNAITLVTANEPVTDGDGNNGNLTLDFGLTGTGSLGDFVWHDLDADGIQGAEPGRKDVKVVLTYPNGSTAEMLTDVWGKYLFTNLAPGNYVVTFTAPDHFFITLKDQGSDDAKDSDADRTTGTVSVTLGAGENNMTIDAGVYCEFLSVGNYVWYDRNNDGVQDATEKGISGVTVKLYLDANGDNTPDGAAIATTTTNANGLYTFSSLIPGRYIAGITIPAGYKAAATTATSATPDNDDNTDNNGVQTVAGELLSNFITLITLNEPDIALDGDNYNGNTTLDFGLTGTGSIGDYVWHDLDADGIQGAEPGRKDVKVVLTYPDGSTVSGLTDVWGKYLFTNLAPGTYVVTFTAPDMFEITFQNQGSDDTKDSDADRTTGAVSITLGASENNITIDAGVYCHFLYLGDLVWNDVNNNGQQDAGEQGISGATVKLYWDSNRDNVPDGPAIATTTTNAGGLYSFKSLMAGKYIVGVTIPAGYTPSTATATSTAPDNDNNTDNNGVNVIGNEVFSNYITLVTLKEPEAIVDGDNNNGNATLDFGFYQGYGYGYGYASRTVAPAKATPVKPVQQYHGFNVTGVYPNPFVDKVVLSYTSGSAQKAAVRIFDNAGKTVYQSNVAVNAGKNNIELNGLNRMKQGAYTIELQTAEGRFTRQLVK